LLFFKVTNELLSSKLIAVRRFLKVLPSTVPVFLWLLFKNIPSALDQPHHSEKKYENKYFA
jgi:hypothetical protein